MVEQGRYGLELLGLYGFTSFFVVSGSCFRPLGLGQISPEAEELIYIYKYKYKYIYIYIYIYKGASSFRGLHAV